ncbi:MAG TPA: DUF6128 domain-containing protein [Anaerobutyricum hallii]|uniref:DUF6128 domain-containing protein n=2 Tax=Anaerobutyricum hallii TaxID=39488 RepID=UPI00242D04CD|nr:DUF6128 domain-containing protein [Anaerobutyricum hallii]HJH96647.1 DUF6128 domain-containing protein [Anaerobutyricum hallii]
MADYQRILSYLYRYEKAEKKECFGFVKAEQKSGSLKLTIQIDDERLLQGMELKLCFYERQGESWQVWQLDTLITQEYKEEIHLTYPAAMLPAGFRIKGQSGVLLYYQDAFYYGSVWIGEEIPTETLEPLRWHKIVNSAKDKSQMQENKSQMQENKSGKDIAGKISEKQTETEKILPDKMSEKQKVSTRNITDEMLQEQQESEENILEKKGQINTESFEEKDFQKRAENKIENIKSEENLPDSENDIAHSNNTNIEESVKIKEFSEDGIESKNKSELELKSGLKTDAEIESKSELKTDAEIESKSELKTDAEMESKSELKIDSEIEPQIKIEAETEPEATSVVDNFEKMWINAMKKNPSVDNIFNTAFYEGCRISTADLAQFGEEASVLKSNQFLLKGYGRYHHILAGKVRYAGEERYCIGVPGIYENREKYMAEIYQFPVFLSLTENRMKTGSFGYWLYLLRDGI